MNRSVRRRRRKKLQTCLRAQQRAREKGERRIDRCWIRRNGGTMNKSVRSRWRKKLQRCLRAQQRQALRRFAFS